MRTLTLLLPLYYNPGRNGFRTEVESWKLEKTESEIRKYFSGYSVSQTSGWYRDSTTGEEFRDCHLRFDIDLPFPPSTEVFLRQWKRLLQERMMQKSIYMKLSDPIKWV